MPGFVALLEGDFAAAVEPYRQMCKWIRGNPMGRLFYVAVLILNRRIDTASQSQTHSIPRCATACPHESPASWRVLLLARCDINMSLEGIEQLATAADVFPRMIAEAMRLPACRTTPCAGSRLPSIAASSITRFWRNTIPVSRASAASRNSSS